MRTPLKKKVGVPRTGGNAGLAILLNLGAVAMAVTHALNDGCQPEFLCVALSAPEGRIDFDTPCRGSQKRFCS